MSGQGMTSGYPLRNRCRVCYYLRYQNDFNSEYMFFFNTTLTTTTIPYHTYYLICLHSFVFGQVLLIVGNYILF